MNWIKVLLTNALVLVLGTVTVLVIFEFHLRSNLEKFHSYGWIKDNSIGQLVDDCQFEDGTIGVFGDSFVEYYRGSNANISEKLAVLDSSKNFCNFGLSGTGFDVYLARFEYVVNKVDLQQAIIYLYEGNDFFMVPKLDGKADVLSFDRKQNPFFNVLKKSASLNFVWREIFKKYWPNDGLKVPSSGYLDCPFDEKLATEKVAVLKKSNPTLYRDFSTNQLNVSWLQVALKCPDYFNRISETHPNTLKNYEAVSAYINEMQAVAVKRGINLTFVVIPHDYFVGNESKDDWETVFQFDPTEFIGPTVITQSLLRDFKNIHYAKTLVNADFLRFDGHLKPIGNEKLAKFTHDLLK